MSKTTVVTIIGIIIIATLSVLIGVANNYQAKIINWLFDVVSSDFEKTAQKSEKETACLNSGGTVVGTDCYCSGVNNFPSMCEIGVCTCNPIGGVQYRVKICDCGEGKCFNGESCVNFPY